MSGTTDPGRAGRPSRAVRARMLLQLRRARGSAVYRRGRRRAGGRLQRDAARRSITRRLAARRTRRRCASPSTAPRACVPGKNEVRWAGVVVGRITDAELSRRPGGADRQARPEQGPAAVPRRAPEAAPRDGAQRHVPRRRQRRHARGRGRLRADDVLDAGRTRSTVDVAEVLNAFSVSVRDRLQQALDELVGRPARRRRPAALGVRRARAVRPARRSGSATSVARRDRATRRLVNRVRLITDELGAARPLDHAPRPRRRRDVLHARRPARRARRDPARAAAHAGQMRGVASAGCDGTLGRDAARARRAATGGARPAGRPATRCARSSAARPRPARAAARRSDPDPARRDLAPTAARCRSAFERLEPQLPRLDRITAQASRCKREVQKFFAWTMSVFKFGNTTNRTSSPRGA